MKTLFDKYGMGIDLEFLWFILIIMYLSLQCKHLPVKVGIE